MACERHFIVRREYSHASSGACFRIRRRENECGLREVELTGKGLHVLVADAGAVLEHTERIAGKGNLALREYVNDAERVSCHERNYLTRPLSCGSDSLH